MARKRESSWDLAVAHALAQPEFAKRSDAQRFFRALRAERRARIRQIVKRMAGPPVHDTRSGLHTLELWALELAPADLGAASTSRSELATLLQWHWAEVALKVAPGAAWVVAESEVSGGRWEAGVESGLCTHLLTVAVEHGDEGLPTRRSRWKTPWTDCLDEMLSDTRRRTRRSPRRLKGSASRKKRG